MCANATNLAPWPAHMAKQPWEHQHLAYDFIGSLWASDMPGAALISEMGTGKSLTAIALIRAMQFKRVLLVSGAKSMVPEWGDMVREESCGRLNSHVLEGSTVQKAAQLKELHETGRPFVAIVNVESYWREPLGKIIESIPWDAMMVDESQRIKSPSSRQSKFAHKLARKFPNMKRLILTGTPLHNSPLDVYGQFRFVDARIFGTNYDAFKNEYAVQVNIGRGIWIVTDYKNLDKLAEKMHKVSFRVDDSVLKLPELLPPIVRRVDLTPKNMKVYKELEKEFVVDFRLDKWNEHDAEGVTITPTILARMARLQQITSGILPSINDYGEEVINQIGTEKRDALQDLLEELNERVPVVVFARFKHDLAQIRGVAEALKRPYLEQSGRTHQWREFRDRDDNCIIGVQTRAGGAGIQLQRANYAIFYSHVQSLGDYQQAVKRLHRPGQTKPTFVYHLVANNTIDGKITAALKAKADIGRFVVDDYRKIHNLG